MKLNISKRSAGKKSDVAKIRREGDIPAIIYESENQAQAIVVKGTQFKALLRTVKPGHLPTTVFTLIGEDGKEHRAIIKDIQYKITTYDVTHLDFEELVADVPVNVKVPIECINVADCEGIKLGGALRQVIRHLKVRCLPKDIPSQFTIDMKGMGMRDAKRLSDLNIPNTIRPQVSLNEVAVVIVKR